MTSPQHRTWIANGQRWQLARPLAALRDRLRHYGYRVDDLGDTRHLDAEPPEDHTPYSETGWPIKTPDGWVTAIDPMPPAAGSGLPALAELSAQIYADRQAGVLAIGWLKYMNWTDADGNCWHDSWEPNHVRRPSSDRGHIHLSGRSDRINSAAGDAYDPVARLRASKNGVTQVMFRIGIKGGDGAIYLSNGAGRTHIGPDLNADLEAAGVPLAWVDDTAALDQATLFAAATPALPDDVGNALSAIAGQLGTVQATLNALSVPPPASVDVAALVDQLRPELQEVAEGAAEQAVRTVLGSLDEVKTTPDAEPSTK